MIPVRPWCTAAVLVVALGSAGCGSGSQPVDATANVDSTPTVADEANDSADSDTTSDTTSEAANDEDAEETNETDPAEDGEDSALENVEDTEVETDGGDTASAVTDHDDPVDTPDSDDASAELVSFLAFFGVSEAELETVSSCVIDEGNSEGLTPTDLIADGSAFLALLDCAPDMIGETMRAYFADLDTSGLSATPEQIDCTFDATFDFLRDVPLTEAASVLDADKAPMEFVDALVDTCGVTVSDAEFLLNDA